MASDDEDIEGVPDIDSFFDDEEEELSDEEEEMEGDFEDEEPRKEKEIDTQDLVAEPEEPAEQAEQLQDKLPVSEAVDMESDDEDEDLDDITQKDRLAYERLIIEGADIENAEEEMKSMDETLAEVQETYLTGSAYDTAAHAPPTPKKTLEDFPYKPMPELSMQLSTLLEQIKMESEAALMLERWGDATVTGLQSKAQNVKPGNVFCAKRTAHYDGIKDIPLAVENGAVAIFFQHGKEIEDDPSEETGLENGLNAPVDANDNTESTEKDPEGWRTVLEAEGISVDLIEIEAAIFPVQSLTYCMSALSCVFYGYPSNKMKIFGVVGSHGKGSTAWILRQILEGFDVCTGMMTDMEYTILGDQLTEEGDLFIATEDDPAYLRTAATPYHLTPFKGRYSIDEAVPDALQVHKVLAGMAYRGAQACIIECPTEALEEGRLQHVAFDVLIYTNLEAEISDTPESFDLMKSINAEIFSQLQIPEGQRAIINMDDPHAQAILDRASEAPVVTYSLNNQTADVYTEEMTRTIWETEVVIRTPLGKIQIITPMIGTASIYNVLAAVATAVSVNVDLNTIVNGIEALDYIPGRYEVVDEGQDFSVIVDRANSAPRLISLIQNLKECGARRVLLVFGCSWYHSQKERSEMGSAAHFHADIVIITSDAPAGESPDRVIDDIIAGFPEDVLSRSALWVNSPWQDPGRVAWWFEEWLFRAQKELRRHIVEDRSLAIRGAIGTARKGDVVVVAGRGERDYSWWIDKDGQPFKTWYEDRREVRDALRKLPHLHKSQVITDKLPWSEPEDVQDTKTTI